MQRSVRENIALPFSARLAAWGPIDRRREGAAVGAAIERLQIDTRAQAEVQRLSGGNQQKVTIARWIAAEARTILCFDPTRGIDVRTKQEIYRLLRELAAQGKSVLFYTSDLEEVPLVCDRVVVIFAGRVVDAFPAEHRRRGDPDPRRLRPAARSPRRPRHDPLAPPRGLGRRPLRALRARSSSPPALIQPGYGGGDFGSLARAVLPYAFAVAAQTVVVIAGGIDLSVASMMALTSVTAARAMASASDETAALVVVLVLLLGLALGALNGLLIVVTRVPDIVVTLAMLFVLQGAALLVLPSPRRRRAPLAQGRSSPARSACPGSRRRSSSSSSASPPSGSRCAARSSASRSTPSARTSSPPSAAASRSRAPASPPTPSPASSPRWAASR